MWLLTGISFYHVLPLRTTGQLKELPFGAPSLSIAALRPSCRESGQPGNADIMQCMEACFYREDKNAGLTNPALSSLRWIAPVLRTACLRRYRYFCIAVTFLHARLFSFLSARFASTFHGLPVAFRLAHAYRASFINTRAFSGSLCAHHFQQQQMVVASTSEIAVPLRPARPVRPMRCR